MRKNKRAWKLTAMVLVLAQLLMFVQPALAAGERDVLNLTPPLVTLTSATFKAFESDGTTEIADYDNIPQDAKIKLEYFFTVNDAANPADDVKAGDYFTVDLPAALTNIARFDTSFTLTHEFEGITYTIGTATVSGGVVTFTFDEDIEDLSDVSTSVKLTGEFEDDNIGDDTDASFTLLAGGTPYYIGFEDDEPTPEEPEVSITKDGTYNPATNEITWTVTVHPIAGETLTNVTVTDVIGANQTF